MSGREVEVSPPMEVCDWPLHAWMTEVEVTPEHPLGWIIFVRVGNVITSFPLHVWREIVDRFYRPLDLYHLPALDKNGRAMLLEVEVMPAGVLCAAWVHAAPEDPTANPLGFIVYLQLNEHIQMFPLHEFRAILDSFLTKLYPE